MKFESFTLKSGVTIQIPTPQSYADCYQLALSDMYRWTGRKPSFLQVLARVMIHPFRNYLFWMRMSRHKGILYPFFLLMHKFTSLILNIDIPRNTRIGYGFYLGHSMCIVINQLTIIGNNVNFSQFVNVGTNKGTPAMIADQVYVGPSSCIIEDVEIGPQATIGAGAVVISDIEAQATAVGSPARTVSHNNPAQYIRHPYPLP